jgi:hypothetical protein
MRRIVNEVTPIAMIGRPVAGNNGGNARGAVAENRFQPPPIRRHGMAEGIVFDDLPAAGINENEYRKDVFHGGGGWIGRFVITAFAA